jgi:protein ImuA
MNKNQTDSIRMVLPDAGWGHALAALGGALDKAQSTAQGMAQNKTPAQQMSLADILAQLPANACHEILASEKHDAASLFGFGMMLATLLSTQLGRSPCFIVRSYQRSGGRLYPPGLAEMGIDPARFFNIHAPDFLAALKATADIARSGAAGAVLMEVEGNPRLLDLTASRRLALAAEKTGTAVLLLRLGARAVPSAAYSRWQVSAASSLPLLAGAPGAPAFAVTLLRHRRMGAARSAQLTWNQQEQRFNEHATATTSQEKQPAQTGAPPFGAALSLVTRRKTDRTAGPGARRAA